MEAILRWMCTILLATIAIERCQSQDLIGPSPANQGVLRDGTHTLTCSKSASVENQLSWEDDTDGGGILMFLGTSKISPETKYSNFEVISDNAEELNLVITAAEVEDDGIYNCKLAGSSTPGQGATLQVEVVGSPLAITPMDGDKVTVTDGETSNIVCTATGYRPVVTIEWYHKKSGGQEVQITEGVSQTDSVNPSDGDTSDVVGTLEYTASKDYNNGEVKCVATGLYSQENDPQTTATLNVQYEPTITKLQYDGRDDVNMVICSSDANPEVSGADYRIIVNDTDVYTPTCADGECTLSLDVQYDTDVRCNATNSIGTGTKTIIAVPGAVITTPEPTTAATTKSDGGDKDAISTDAGPNVGAIAAGVVVGIIVLAVIIALLVYFLVIRKGNKTKNSQGSELKPVNGSGGDSSKPKDRPTPAPRNSKGDAHDNEEGKKKVKPNDNPDGLLYAQLDHSNKPARNSGNGNNIIRTEEPTEYADVKTFIV